LRACEGSTCALKAAGELPAHQAPLDIVTVPDTTHFFPLERPELVREALLTGLP
jgi:pimeloyl-ACP methyl ester carboxylesterase